MCTCLFSRSVWESLRFTEGILNEDGEIIIDVYFRCNKVSCTSKAYYYYYRANDNSITSNFNLKKYYYEFLGYVNILKYKNKICVDLYLYTLNFAIGLAFKIIRYNCFLHFLTNEEKIFVNSFINNSNLKDFEVKHMINYIDYKTIKILYCFKALEYRIKCL